MVAKGSGTDGWHRELADSWRLKTLFLGGGRGGQANTQQQKRKDDHFPLFPPPPSVRVDHLTMKKVTQAAGDKMHLHFSSSRALPPSSPSSRSSSPEAMGTSTIPTLPGWVCHRQVIALPRNSRPQDSDRAKSQLQERGKPRGCWLWRSGCLKYHSSWTCCL